jgi:hypothetical protein
MLMAGFEWNVLIPESLEIKFGSEQKCPDISKTVSFFGLIDV